MTVVAVSHNVTTHEDFEGSPPGVFTNDGGGGPGGAARAGLHYEGAQAADRRIQTASTLSGFTYALPATPGPFSFLASGNLIWWGKIFTALAGGITSTGSRLHCGDTITDLYAYQVGDDGTMGDGQFALPPSGGYVLIPIEVRVNAWRNLPDRGSPDLTANDTFGIQHHVSATTGAGVSQALDSIHTSDDGLFLVSGTGADPAGTFADFLGADEGEGLTGAERVGMWSSKQGVFFVYGKHAIGVTDGATSTETVFTDSLQTLIFPGGFLGDGGNQLEINLVTANTAVTWNNITIIGQGRSRRVVHFDTELDVNATADDIDILGHGLNQGDQIIYFANGGSEDIGPNATTNETEFAVAGGRGTTGDRHYVIKTDDDIINISLTADDAYGAAPTNDPLTPSSAGNGERHSLFRAPATVPNILVSGSTGTFAMNNCTIVGGNILTLTAGVTINGGTYVNCDLIFMAGAEIDGATFITPTMGISEEFISASDTDLDSAGNGLRNCSFTSSGTGHAVKCTSAGTVGFENNAFSGYFASDEDNTGGWSFNASSDVTGGATDTITITGHSFATGDPVHYSDEGLTAITELTDDALYFVRSVDVNTVAMYLTHRAATDDVNRISLTPGTSETHKLYSANAAFWNDSGGLVTLNITDGGGTPTVRNTSGSTTTVNNAVNITVTCLDATGAAIQNAQVSVHEGTDPLALGPELMNEDTNASGVATESFNFSGDQAITIRIRKNSTGDTRYFPVATTGTITSNGFTLVRTLVEDNIAT